MEFTKKVEAKSAQNLQKFLIQKDECQKSIELMNYLSKLHGSYYSILDTFYHLVLTVHKEFEETVNLQSDSFVALKKSIEEMNAFHDNLMFQGTRVFSNPIHLFKDKKESFDYQYEITFPQNHSSGSRSVTWTVINPDNGPNTIDIGDKALFDVDRIEDIFVNPEESSHETLYPLGYKSYNDILTAMLFEIQKFKRNTITNNKIVSSNLANVQKILENTETLLNIQYENAIKKVENTIG